MAGVIGLVLLGLAAPRVIAAALALPSRSVLWDLYSGVEVPVERIRAAEAALAAAGRWSASGELELDRGFLLLRAAVRTPVDGAAPLYEAAERATVDGLALAPGNPGAWLRLAWLRERRGDMAGAVAALRMSFLTGSFEPVIMVDRLTLALRLRPYMDAEMEALLRRQIRQTWVIRPGPVMELGAQPETAALVAGALAELTGLEMERHVRMHGQPQVRPGPN